MAENPHWAPLFPLGLVLLPRENLPLHIFEARYRAMTDRCEREAIPFGIVLAREGGMAAVGCEARIETTLRLYPDGRRDLLARGEERFRLHELREHKDGYLEGKVEILEDEGPSADSDARKLLVDLYRDCRRLHGQVFGATTEALGAVLPAEEELDPEAREVTSFDLAAQVTMDPEDRQALLEISSEAARVEYLLAYLARLRPRLLNQVESGRRVHTNGKVEPHD